MRVARVIMLLWASALAGCGSGTETPIEVSARRAEAGARIGGCNEYRIENSCGEGVAPVTSASCQCSIETTLYLTGYKTCRKICSPAEPEPVTQPSPSGKALLLGRLVR